MGNIQLMLSGKMEMSEFIVNDKVNKENVDEFIIEFENYSKKTEKFNYDELGENSKIIYDMLTKIKAQQ